MIPIARPPITERVGLNLLLAFALGSTLGLFLTRGGCSTCGKEELFLNGVPLSLIGVITYTLFFILNIFSLFQLLTLSLAGILGVHTAILSSFRQEEACAYCLTAFLAVAGALLLTLKAHYLPKITALCVFTLTLTVTSLVIHSSRLLVMGNPAVYRLLDTFAADSQYNHQFVNVIVFTSPSCGLCKHFREDYLPRLNEDSERPIRIYYATSPVITSFPTLFLIGRKTTLYPGLPPYHELLNAINNS